MIFRPFIPKIYINDPLANYYVYLEWREYVKYLGVLIDYRLSGKFHIDSVVLKINKKLLPA